MSRLHKIEIDALAKQFLEDNEVSLKGKEISTSEDEECSNQSAPSSPKGINDAGISMITKVRPQISHIMIKLVVNSNCVLNKIADRNCIVEGLIPTKYLQKGTTKLYSATGERIYPRATYIAPLQIRVPLYIYLI